MIIDYTPQYYRHSFPIHSVSDTVVFIIPPIVHESKGLRYCNIEGSTVMYKGAIGAALCVAHVRALYCVAHVLGRALCCTCWGLVLTNIGELLLCCVTSVLL